jgi:serine/threonine-protein kinase RsbW
MGAEDRIVVTLDSVLDSVELAEEAALRFAEAAGVEEEDRHKVGMSVREGVINALQYGNKMSPEKKTRLILQRHSDKLEIRILDQGSGFRLEDIPDPLAEENLLKSSGRGILLMRSFMDEFDVLQAPEGGAELVMCLKLRSQAGSRGSPPAKEEQP